MVSDENDIWESLRILLGTIPGERIMHPTYGCGLGSLTFENISEHFITEIKDVIERAILFFEPRISLNSIEVTTTRQLEGVVEILLDYNIRATNTRSNMVYPFYFAEGTNIVH